MIAINNLEFLRSVGLPGAVPAAPDTRQRSSGSAATAPVDRLELSSEGTLLARLANEPGIRFEMVARIRAEIQSGTYDVDSAARMDAVTGRLFEELA